MKSLDKPNIQTYVYTCKKNYQLLSKLLQKQHLPATAEMTCYTQRRKNATFSQIKQENLKKIYWEITFANFKIKLVLSPQCERQRHTATAHPSAQADIWIITIDWLTTVQEYKLCYWPYWKKPTQAMLQPSRHLEIKKIHGTSDHFQKRFPKWINCV